MGHPLSRVWALLLAAWLFGCGSDSGVPMGSSDSGVLLGSSDFSTSECKKELKTSALADIRTLKVIEDESGLAGLRCIAWQRLANELKVDLYNFDGACGAHWIGAGAMASDGTVVLDVSNPSCMVTQCGECLYDWSFDMKTSVASGTTVPVTIVVDPCESTVAPSGWSEMIGVEDQGIHCVFAAYTAVILQAGATGTSGTSGIPCVGAGQTCAKGLVCDNGAAANQPLCLVPCTTDVDCPRTDAWSCQTGLCRPRRP